MLGRRSDGDATSPGAARTRGGTLPATSPPVVARRPDESMSLLTDLYRTALDDEYREAAARRLAAEESADTDTPSGESPGARVPGGASAGPVLRRPAVTFAGALVVIGLLLVTVAIEQRREAPALAAERASLVQRIDDVTARAASLVDEVAAAQVSLTDLQDSALQTTQQGELVSAELADLGMLSAATAVVGPGLVVVVDNAPPDTEPADDAAGEGLVQDLDLQQLVNGLWAAGAEAIAVDGVRVGARTSIRAAGDALFMDLHPLSAPYEVTAIGDPDSLGARFLDTYGAGWLEVLASAYGIRYDVESRDTIEIPAVASADLAWAAAYEGRNT